MATTTTALALDVAPKIIETHTSISYLNKFINSSKKYEKSPAGVYNVASVRLEQIKTSWNQFKGVIQKEHRYFEAVDLQIASTEKKVAKLLKNDLSQSLTPVEQIKQRANARGYIVFYDSKADQLTACFANSHPCKIEFGGRIYQNAESVFQAQKFKDQPDIMSLFEKTDGSAALQLASKYQMTPSVIQEWESNTTGKAKDIMMHVLRAKFGQNPDFKEKLMATEKAYLAKHSTEINAREKFWGDWEDGQGTNALGNCLVKLRGEYGGPGTIADYKPEELNMLYQTYPKQALDQDVAPAQKQSQDVLASEEERCANEAVRNCTQQ